MAITGNIKQNKSLCKIVRRFLNMELKIYSYIQTNFFTEKSYAKVIYLQICIFFAYEKQRQISLIKKKTNKLLIKYNRPIYLAVQEVQVSIRLS